jgi:amino-acid N-acetyltransferase
MEAVRESLPEKINKDCVNCPRLHNCDEVTMVRGEIPRYGIMLSSVPELVRFEA